MLLNTPREQMIHDRLIEWILKYHLMINRYLYFVSR